MCQTFLFCKCYEMKWLFRLKYPVKSPNSAQKLNEEAPMLLKMCPTSHASWSNFAIFPNTISPTKYTIYFFGYVLEFLNIL